MLSNPLLKEVGDVLLERLNASTRMASLKASRVATIYDERSSKYDESFHPRQAEDFIKWAELQPGQNVLDFCCGTGLVTILARQAVGSKGRVVGVDVSKQMLEEARRKAADAKLEISFITGDVTEIDRQALSLKDDQGFDLITCASGLTLLGDPMKVLRHWATFLSPAGKLIVDYPTRTSMVIGNLLERTLLETASPSVVVFGRHGIDSVASFEQAIRIAGLAPIRVFETDSYGTNQTDAKDARVQFDKWIKYTDRGEITDPKLRERSVGRFQELMDQAANSAGVVEDDIRFNVAIAGKRL